ncbi:class I SAM-dependent methyltransferase [Priestia koreensis]|uniref:class I SAM-dependent methyltransferase n=1 Tax=Priestia koreensis TaxID=284581 RepID=UPI0006A95007|nr:class I SAM-dependent methyltransferase [Priestia koreensis]
MQKLNLKQAAKMAAKRQHDVPYELFSAMSKRGISLTNKVAVDMGCGSGALTRELSNRGALAIGIDSARSALEEAKSFPSSERIQYIQASAEKTGLQTSSIDVITIMRAWQEFNRSRAIKEINRILTSRGYVIIMDGGFLPRDPLIKETFHLIQPYMPTNLFRKELSKNELKSATDLLPIEWYKEWQESGLHVIDTSRIEYSVSYSTEEWCGRVYSLSWLQHLPEAIRDQLLEELYLTLHTQDPHANHRVLHGCNMVILQKSS